MQNFIQILDSLDKEIKKKYSTVDVVRAHQHSRENKDDVYQFINLVHVPASLISEVEDYAYGLLRIISPAESLPIGFFLFTPEETAAKFPEYSQSATVEFTAQTACSLFQNARKPGKWQISFSTFNYDGHKASVEVDIYDKTIMAGQPLFSDIGGRGSAANTELALAA